MRISGNCENIGTLDVPCAVQCNAAQVLISDTKKSRITNVCTYTFVLCVCVSMLVSARHHSLYIHTFVIWWLPLWGPFYDIDTNLLSLVSLPSSNWSSLFSKSISFDISGYKGYISPKKITSRSGSPLPIFSSSTTSWRHSLLVTFDEAASHCQFKRNFDRKSAELQKFITQKGNDVLFDLIVNYLNLRLHSAIRSITN